MASWIRKKIIHMPNIQKNLDKGKIRNYKARKEHQKY